MNKKCGKRQTPTYQILATVTQIASGRSGQLVNEEVAAVLNPDVDRPQTVEVKVSEGPMKTHSTVNDSLGYCRMSTGEPARRMRTAVIYRHHLSRHLLSCCSSEPVPSLRKVEAVTFSNGTVTEAFLSVCLT